MDYGKTTEDRITGERVVKSMCRRIDEMVEVRVPPKGKPVIKCRYLMGWRGCQKAGECSLLLLVEGL